MDKVFNYLEVNTPGYFDKMLYFKQSGVEVFLTLFLQNSGKFCTIINNRYSCIFCKYQILAGLAGLAARLFFA